MNPVMAGVALVLAVVFAALAFSRKRREQQNWQLLAGLAAVFAVALVASIFLPPFEAAPPSGGDGQPGAPGIVNVAIEGLLTTPLSACGDEFCFGLDVIAVKDGPKELIGEKNLQVRTDKEIILLADKIVRVFGEQQGSYGIWAPYTNIFLVDEEGNATVAQVVQPEVAQEEPQEFYVEIYGYPEGDWYGCGGKQCVEFAVLAENLNKGPIPGTVTLRKNEAVEVSPSALVYGLYSNGFVEVETAGVVNEPLS